MMKPQVSIILESALKLYSPVPRPSGDIVLTCENGSVVKLVPEGSLQDMFSVGGQATGIAMDGLSGKFFSIRFPSVPC